MRWLTISFVVVLGVPLAGCLGGTPAESGSDADLRRDGATATYTVGSNEFVLSSAASPVWTPQAQRTTGLLVRVSSEVESGDGSTSALPPPVQAFGMDYCGNPLWAWTGAAVPTEENYGEPNFVGQSYHPGEWQTAWSLRRTDLPSTGTVVLEKGGLELHVRSNSGGWQAAWRPLASDPTSTKWSESVRLEWSSGAPFPERVGIYRLKEWSNEGALPICAAEQPLDRFAWGPWGPEQDFPFGHSFKAMVEQMLANPALLSLQAQRTAHPDSYIAQVIGVTEGAFGSFPPTSYHYQLSIGYPGAVEGVGVLCEVQEVGPEQGLAAYACGDTLRWSASPANPDPNWDEVEVADSTTFFDFARRYNPSRNQPIVASFGTNERDEAGLQVGVHSFFGGNVGIDVDWDPQLAQIRDVRGLNLESFLNPPEPSS